MKKFTIIIIIALIMCGALTACGVTTPQLKGLTIGTYQSEMTVGDEQTLTYTLNPTDYVATNVTYTSSNPAVATVTNGLVEAVAVGEAVITINIDGVSKTANITVVAPVVELQDLTIGAYQSEMTVGDEQTLTYTLNPTDYVATNVTYTSSNPAVATVTNGLVEAVAVGEAIITINVDGVSKTANITVVAAEVELQDVTIGAYQSEMTVGDEQTLTYTLNPTDYVATNVTYTSSNPAVVTVTNGLVKAVAVGEAVITINVDGVSKTANITVVAPVVELQDVTIGAYQSEMTVGDEQTLTYTLNPTDYVATNVTYTSSNPAVATVTNGLVEAVAVGEAIITINVDGVSKTANITVVAAATGIDPTAAFNRLIDDSLWNFQLKYLYSNTDGDEYEETYVYDGYNFKNTYEATDGETYVDYIIVKDGKDYYYCQNEDGSYSVYDENSEEYADFVSYLLLLDFSDILTFEYETENGIVYAVDPDEVAVSVLGSYEGGVTVSASFEISNDYLVKMTVVTDITDEYGTYTVTEVFEFSKYDVNTVDDTGLDTEEPKPPVSANISEFTDKDLTVKAGQIAYTADKKANDFEKSGDNRGVQFTMKNGAVKLTSATAVNGVKSVTIVCATNQSKGMEVKVSVGGTYLLYNGQVTAKVAKTTYAELVFTSTTELSGALVVELVNTSDDKSMYITSIAFAGTAGGEVGGDVMPNQVYNADENDDRRLQDYMLDEEGGAIGLPSIGTYDVLVIPVNFTDATISTDELAKLEIAFNGDSVSTGWESVATYYQKASYGKLNLTFDIMDAFNAPSSRSYYSSYSRTVDWGDNDVSYQDGAELLLLQALAYYEPLIDLSNYDYDNDGVIDGVYLIYAGDVDYEEADFYWAYVTWYSAPEAENQMFDGLDAYYYLFAGIDFIYEDVEGGYDYNGVIDGLIVNSATFIHETGHMLSLDDYYDYNSDSLGLGGADIMDYTYGDHCSYSKIMMNWIDPIVVTDNQTIDIRSFEEYGDTIMILLDYNGSYMCEYLLIDLYTMDGLNQMHGEMGYLYGNATYGVRIYHVSGSVNNPYSTDYGSYTDYNNSDTNPCLIYLVEADGETEYVSGDGYVTASDLWQSEDSFASIYQRFTRNDGSIINFNIVINSVSAEGASITIQFVAE